MPFAVVRERGFHTGWVLVIVIDTGLLGVTAACVKPDFGVTFDRVHPSHFKWVEEDNTIECHADGTHGYTGNFASKLWLQR